MIIFKCRFTNDEMLSDAFKPGPVKDETGEEVPGLIQIQSQKVNKVGRCVYKGLLFQCWWFYFLLIGIQ
jgi:Translationally controlled tumour protein